MSQSKPDDGSGCVGAIVVAFCVLFFLTLFANSVKDQLRRIDAIEEELGIENVPAKFDYLILFRGKKDSP